LHEQKEVGTHEVGTIGGQAVLLISLLLLLLLSAWWLLSQATSCLHKVAAASPAVLQDRSKEVCLVLTGVTGVAVARNTWGS
jgi:hypothetical protein